MKLPIGTHVRVLTGCHGSRTGTVIDVRGDVYTVELRAPKLFFAPRGAQTIMQLPYAGWELEAAEA